MDNLYQRSVAAGIKPEVAMRDQWADDVQRFNNRERYAAETVKEPEETVSE